MTLLDCLLFAPVAALIALSPGPNNFCALSHGIHYGVRAALLGAFGRLAAYAIFLSISAVGLGAMLLASERAFTAVKWIGAAYLLYLGIKTWRSRDFAPREALDAPAAAAPRRAPVRRLMLNEFLVGISNPKAILLFAAIFPQFIDPGRPTTEQFVYLGGTYLAMELLAATLAYALFGRQIRRLTGSRSAMRRINRAVGTFFVGAGGALLGLSNH